MIETNQLGSILKSMCICIGKQVEEMLFTRLVDSENTAELEKTLDHIVTKWKFRDNDEMSGSVSK